MFLRTFAGENGLIELSRNAPTRGMTRAMFNSELETYYKEEADKLRISMLTHYMFCENIDRVDTWGDIWGSIITAATVIAHIKKVLTKRQIGYATERCKRLCT